MQKNYNDIKDIDIRIRILLLIVVSLTALLLSSEAALLMCMIFVVIWVSLLTSPAKCTRYIITYFILWGLLFLMKDIRVLGNLPLLTVYIRRLMIPVMMSIPVVNAPTGKLIASLNRMRIPKSATISLAVLFRFMPTIIQEYHSIRETQKFRGIGTSIPKTLISLPSTSEYILIPMLIRTSKVADELTASAQVRGVKTEGKCSSFYEIQIGRSEYICIAIGIAFLITVFVIDKFAGGL